MPINKRLRTTFIPQTEKKRKCQKLLFATILLPFWIKKLLLSSPFKGFYFSNYYHITILCKLLSISSLNKPYFLVLYKKIHIIAFIFNFLKSHEKSWSRIWGRIWSLKTRSFKSDSGIYKGLKIGKRGTF
ncbi:hypothetical protein PMI13_01568 [Chryseobacterium populi]|uniref:Uncharacterized protein n=1 Tax=Chryseobacterium populi TaxID=1144316 RepID=J2JZJ9_9FLAO|nr:hypothetical protein PMI13_01568 [Chryseobacterium populi]